MPKETKTEKLARVRGMLDEWSRTAYPDAKDIPEDRDAADEMQRASDRLAARILDTIVRDGLI
jgi:hypothetical protein